MGPKSTWHPSPSAPDVWRLHKPLLGMRMSGQGIRVLQYWLHPVMSGTVTVGLGVGSCGDIKFQKYVCVSLGPQESEPFTGSIGWAQLYERKPVPGCHSISRTVLSLPAIPQLYPNP